MTRKAVRFTQADVARCIRAAQQCGADHILILPDGTIEIKLRRDEEARRDSESTTSKWDDAYSKPERRRIGERLHSTQARSDPLAAAYERFTRGEISLDQLPPGKYPNGMRVYADGEWEGIVRTSPLQKRERGALEAYFRAKGTIGYVKGGGVSTTERLAARGFVEVVQMRENGREPYYGITAEGEVAWLAMSGKKDDTAKD